MRRRAEAQGLARLFSDRERRILGYLYDRARESPAADAHVYEIAHAIELSEPTTLRGLMELLSTGLVLKKRPRMSTLARNTFVRPYALTETGRRICEMLAKDGKSRGR